MKNHHHHHYNHHSPPREPPPPRDPSPASKKPPRPPPLSVSIPDSPPRPEPNPFPNSNSTSNSDESPHSPLRSDSQTAGPIVPVEKYYSPLTSPLPITPPKDPSAPHHVISFNRREEPPPQTAVVKSAAAATSGGRRRVGFVTSPAAKEEGGGGGNGGRTIGVVEKVGLGVRVLEFVFCLVSFSVMATDKTQGWSGDSFDRYKEYRFCLTVNIFGFVYSGFQAYDLAYHLATGKHVIAHHLRYQFDFILDQIIAYLLISASSAAATRVVDWQANWGKDAFTEKASASISMAFLAFFAFALSSLISGYNLCNRDIS